MFDTLLYLLGSIITVICIILCVVLFFTVRSKDSKGNRITFDYDTKEKPWSFGLWLAGVFVAGTGVALMYAPSDLLGYVQNGLNSSESVLMLTLLNGAPVWAMYSIMGLWYMKHMDSKIGKIAAMLSTVLGMSISLWTGTNTIVNFLGFEIPGLKFILAGIMVGIAMLSSRFDLLKNISKLAFLVFLVAFLILIATPKDSVTLHPIEGGITKEFWKQYFIGETSASWIFWFLSWTPTVSRWLAQISKGRTMKEYIAGTMFIPTAVALIWMGVSWKYQEIIMSFNLKTNLSFLIPCIIFIASGMLFMIGTLDSDCKVFTEDLVTLSNNRLKQDSLVPYYGLFVIFLFCLFISGIIVKPFAFNEYSALCFVPVIIWSIISSVKVIFNKRTGSSDIKR